jgi:hypothetical protein
MADPALYRIRHYPGIYPGRGRGRGIKIELGGCPRIEIFSQIEAFLENKRRHTLSIPSIIFKK